MTIIYHYDGSFPGFLCMLDEALHRKEHPFAIITADAQEVLWGEVRVVERDDVRALACWRWMKAHFGVPTVRLVMRAFLADDERRDLRILDYLSFLCAVAPHGTAALAHPAVKGLDDLARQVTVEAHRLTGLVRFTQVRSQLLVAPIEPTHRVLPLIAPHFVRRLPGERWLIADLRHAFGYYWDTVSLREVEPGPEIAAVCNRPCTGASDDPYESLWRRYVQVIAIAERRNPRAQRRFMPERYWRHLTEKR